MALSLHSAAYTTNLGTVLANRPVTIRMVHKALSAAVVYSDQYGVTPMTSPTTNGSGVLTFYGDPGLYSIAIGPYRYNVSLGGSFVGVGESDVTRVRKSVREQTSTVGVEDDAELFLAVDANSTYRFTAFIKGYAEPTTDFRITFTGPAGSTLEWTVTSIAETALSNIGNLNASLYTGGQEARVGGGSDDTTVINVKGFIYTGASSGLLLFRRGVWNAPVEDPDYQDGSWMELHRLL